MGQGLRPYAGLILKVESGLSIAETSVFEGPQRRTQFQCQRGSVKRGPTMDL